MRLLSRLLLAVGSLLVLFVLLELGFRAAGADPNANPRWRYDAALGWTIDPSWPLMDSVNASGFRHRAPHPDREDRRRLLVLGDSFTLGGRYDYAQTFPGLLDGWLNGGGPGDDDAEERWDVVSLAVGGWGTGQQWLALRDIGLAQAPDAVVLQLFPHNDLCNNTLALAFTCSVLDIHRPYFELGEDGLTETRLSPSRHQLRRRSRLYGWFEARLRWRWSPANVDQQLALDKPRLWQARLLEYHRERIGLDFDTNLYSLVPPEGQPEAVRGGWRVTELLLERIGRTLDERGIPLIAVVVPYVNTFDPKSLSRRRAVRRLLVPDHATRTTERMLARHGATVISLTQRIRAGRHRPDSYFYPHASPDKHLNFFGHYLVGTSVLAELRALGLTDRPAPPDPLAEAL